MIRFRFPLVLPLRPLLPGAIMIAASILLPSAFGELIPANRLINWTPGVRTGVIGGIPTNRTHLIDVTRPPYNADNTGATDVQPTLQAAANAAGSGDVVYLPAGRYRIDSALNLGSNFNGKTLRGAGPNVTIIDQRTVVGLILGSRQGVSPPQETPVRVTAGIAKGSTSVTVSPNTDNLSTGQLILFLIQNDQTIPVASVYNYDVFTSQATTNQEVRIISKTSNTITFTPPLMDDYGGGDVEVRIFSCSFQGVGIGLEDLTVDCGDFTAYSNVEMDNLYGGWIKNCKISGARSYPLVMNYALNCEVRHSRISGVPGIHTNGAGLLFTSYSCLVEDNIIIDAFPTIEVNGGSAGNVFAYNYGPPDGMWLTNHGPFNQYNLYEGNALGFEMCDGYFGGQNKLTLFRNYFHGDYGVNLKRFNRNTTVIGNMLIYPVGDTGNPNAGNGYSEGTASLINGDPWRDWNMTATVTGRADNNHGEITLSSGRLHAEQTIAVLWGSPHLNHQTGGHVTSVVGNVCQIMRDNQEVFPDIGTTVTIGPGSFFNVDPSTGGFIGSFQERDLDVAATLVQKGNRMRSDNSFQSLEGDTLPNSLYRSSKPPWFNDLEWPPYDPVTPRTPSIEHIPAGYRFVHGVDPPGGPPTPPQPPTGVTVVPSPGPGSATTPAPERPTASPPRPTVSPDRPTPTPTRPTTVPVREKALSEKAKANLRKLKNP